MLRKKRSIVADEKGIDTFTYMATRKRAATLEDLAKQVADLKAAAERVCCSPAAL